MPQLMFAFAFAYYERSIYIHGGGGLIGTTVLRKGVPISDFIKLEFDADVLCSPGTTGEACVLCGPGTYNENYAGECLPCLPGSY